MTTTTRNIVPSRKFRRHPAPLLRLCSLGFEYFPWRGREATTALFHRRRLARKTPAEVRYSKEKMFWIANSCTGVRYRNTNINIDRAYVADSIGCKLQPYQRLLTANSAADSKSSRPPPRAFFLFFFYSFFPFLSFQSQLRFSFLCHLSATSKLSELGLSFLMGIIMHPGTWPNDEACRYFL